MRYFVISDNHDTLVGMRLAGVEGVIVHDRAGVESALNQAAQDPEIGLVLITEPLTKLAADFIDQRKLTAVRPLILEIPDRHGSGRCEDSITRYIRDAIGIKM